MTASRDPLDVLASLGRDISKIRFVVDRKMLERYADKLGVSTDELIRLLSCEKVSENFYACVLAYRRGDELVYNTHALPLFTSYIMKIMNLAEDLTA